MKKSIILSIAAMFIIGFSFNTLSAQVTNASYNYSNNSNFNSHVKTVIQDLENLGYTIVDYDIIKLRKNEKFNWNLTCTGGREYTVFGYTEAGVKDLGLYIYDNNGKYVTANPSTENDGITATKFNAYANTKAQIVAKNEKSQSFNKKYNVALIISYYNKK